MRRDSARFAVAILAGLTLGQGCPMPEPPPTPPPPTPGPDPGAQAPPVTPPANPHPSPSSPPSSQVVPEPDIGRVSFYSLRGMYDTITLEASKANDAGDIENVTGGVLEYLTVGISPSKRSSNTVLNQTMVQFDLSNRPMVAAKVEIWLLCDNTWLASPIYIERITQAWGAFATKVMVDPASRRTLPAPVMGQWYKIDITDWYNSWRAAGVNQAPGFRLRPAVEIAKITSYTWSSFVGNHRDNPGAAKPRLVITTGPRAAETYVFPLDGEYSPARIRGYRFGSWWEQQTCVSDNRLELLHTGIDIAADVNDPVRAIAAGKVMYAAQSETWGGYVVIQHRGFTTCYTHVWPAVVANSEVAAGAVIGTIAPATTYVPHLHFEVRLGAFDDLRMILRGRLPYEKCITVPGEASDAAWPEKRINPEYINWE